MDLYQLKHFYYLSMTKSYTRAALKLHVTQSAISHSIKKLEQSISKKLTIRRGQKFFLTEEGRILFESCRKIFSEIDRVEEKLYEKGDSLERHIVLGATVEFGTTVLMKQFSPFTERHPKIHIDFCFHHDLLPALLREEIDIILDCKNHNQADLKKIPLFHEEYVVIATPEYIKKWKIERSSDLKMATILSMDKNLEWWGNFINYHKRGRELLSDKIIEINHVRGIINAALGNLGVGFVPRYSVLNELKKGTLVDLFPDMKLLDDHFYIYLKSEKYNLKSYRALINFLKDIQLLGVGSGS